VGFVEDHRIVFGNDPAPVRTTQRQIGEIQMVVHDQQPRVFRLTAHARHEALVVMLAARTDPRLRAALQLRPNRGVQRQIGELGAIAQQRSLAPTLD
jgi:hypothetical protein